MSAAASHPVEGHVSRGFEAVREAFADNFARRAGAGRRLLRLSSRREGRRPLGRHPKQADRRAVGAGHHGDRLLGHQGPGRDDAGHRPLPRLARLRRTGVRVLAGVRAAGQRANHRPPAPGAPGRAVRARRARRSQPRRRPRSPGGRAGASETRVGAGNAAGLSRASRSGSTRASCCAVSIRSIAAWDSSSRTRSPRRSGWTSTSGCPRTSRTRAWPRLRGPAWIEMLHGFPLRLTLDAMNRRSNIYRALRGSELPHDEQRVYARNLEVPSGGAVGTARAIAHAYSVFATGGRELGLRPETLDLLAAPAIPPTRGFYDECMKGDGAVLARLHEAEPRLAVRQRQFVRVARSRRLSRLCRSGGWRRLRLRDEPDGDAVDRRPAGCGARRRAVTRSSGFVRRWKPTNRQGVHSGELTAPDCRTIRWVIPNASDSQAACRTTRRPVNRSISIR